MPRVVAILAVRNERPYLANCLGHLIRNGIDFWVIDNSSTDGTRDLLAQPAFARHLAGLDTHPFDGEFDWTGLMRAREAAARRADADWVVFVSADEIMHSRRHGERLADAIARVDAEGWNVINFDEFVFLPLERDYVEDCPGHQPLRHYYFFEPSSPRLMRARRADLDLSHVEHAGHVLAGAPFRLAPESFALRHYLFRNQAHAFSKYRDRRFKAAELEKGWHGNRQAQPVEHFQLPSPAELHVLDDPAGHALERSAPRTLHFWQWKR